MASRNHISKARSFMKLFLWVRCVSHTVATLQNLELDKPGNSKMVWEIQRESKKSGKSRGIVVGYVLSEKIWYFPSFY